MSNRQTIDWNDQFDATVHQWLHDGVVHFQFEKRDHSIRDLYGTLKVEMIPSEAVPTGKREYDRTKYLRVFDKQINQWRTVNKNTVYVADCCDVVPTLTTEKSNE